MVVKPSPAPDEVSLPYWQAARDGALVIQRCRHCGHAQFPPDLICHQCAATELEFVTATGTGTIYSFATYVRTFDEAFPAPYVLALVDIDDYPGVRLMTNIVDSVPDDIEIGGAVDVTFEARGDWQLPQFRLAKGRP